MCQIVAFAKWLHVRMSEENFQFIFRSTVLFAACAVAMSVIVASYLGSKYYKKVFVEVIFFVFRLLCITFIPCKTFNAYNFNYNKSALHQILGQLFMFGHS